MFENCTVKENVSMKDYTSFKTGGIAQLMIEPQNALGVSEACKKYSDYYVLGNGSNLIVSDEGLKKPVIHIGKAMSDVVVRGEYLICQAGALLSKVANEAYKNSLTGMEFAQGIPGSIGGGTVMNAGAYGGELKDVIETVEYVTEDGEIKKISGEEAEFSYRKSFFSDKKYIITSVVVKLKKGNSEEIGEKMKTLAFQRRSKQPLEYPSAGSTFKRPEGHYAAALIEQANLKGVCVGGASVSEKHSGFVINTGSATSSDILTLMEKIKKTVYENSGVMLEAEVKIWE